MCESFEKQVACDRQNFSNIGGNLSYVMLTAMTLVLQRCTNIPRRTKKNPKDTPDRAFINLVCSITFGTDGVLITDTSRFRILRLAGNIISLNLR